MENKDVVAILLAGGKGSRLKDLTDTIPKPALHFGGKYRIIDFVLSNCSNSGIFTVGIITQFEPIELTSYIGSGSAWDLNALDGGVTVLPPYTTKNQEFSWQKGTAHAVYQHLNFLDLYQPKYVIILSTDQIYKMDYSELISFHIQKNADFTISTIEMDDENINRFGILEEDKNGRIISFEEKPENPKSRLVSQGIYVANYPLLKSLLNQLYEKNKLEIDFGLHIIPYMIKHYLAYNYRFTDYWKDIGTVESLYRANMDLIDYPNALKLYDKKWRIFSNTIHMPAHHIFMGASIHKSLVCEGTLIYGDIYHSILSNAVVVGKNSTVNYCVVMPNVEIGNNCIIKNSIIKTGVKVPDNTILDSENITLITDKTFEEVRV